MKEFLGTGVALVTPFNEDKSVDYKALENLVNYQIENGVNYLVVLGTTGEPATLTLEEKEEIKKTIIKANNGKLPLILGIGGNNTQAVINEIKTTDLSAFSAILSVSPYYNKPTQEGIYQHFKAISESSPKPIIVYNVPGRTASNILPKTILRLANDCKNIIGVKEAAGDIVQAMTLIQNKPTNFLVISGDDMIALPMVLAGGAGVISVIGQGYPKDFSSLIQLGLNNKPKEAYLLHYKLMDVINYIFEEGNPAGIKMLLKKLNITSKYVRLPLVEVSNELHQKIADFVENY
ncbi:MAG: 4-hydroxy-tetrahydrodipicolinate synthase [Lutibacter sp.]|uniref:4-hydroxy-tetrahydrodipicolinate synthase n=1 Tax=Lutibacter sp. TaxID=1925666 RepID=UPI00299EDEA4|nr:4-hydroxy-tetrahydrodipicolinate synthase [Lutibacter sp.]MDX1829205.1 4-hydroxy-tetrahydrodipicolinate synthase [Lutibacter sp.]